MSSKHLSQYFRERIVRLWMNGSSVASIISTMTDEGKSVSAVTVRKWIFRWEKNNSLESHHCSGRSSTITSEIAAFMDNLLDEDDELSSSELRRLIVRKFGVSLSSTTIRQYLRKNLEWVVIRTRPVPMISSANKVK
jgi:transposase